MRVRLYVKPTCPLCDGARRLLARLAWYVTVSVEEIDVSGDPGLFSRFGRRVPVIEARGRQFEGEIRADELLAVLAGPPGE